ILASCCRASVARAGRRCVPSVRRSMAARGGGAPSLYEQGRSPGAAKGRRQDRACWWVLEIGCV
ncbi:MAG: hypothetical protein ACRDRF_13455, partial [Pseudonocardiaceae bacterium]